MKRHPRWPALVAAVVLMPIGMTLGSSGATAATAAVSVRNVAVCATAHPGYAECLAVLHERLLGGRLEPNASKPTGYGPSALRSAYNLPSTTAGVGETVAVVDAYNDPNLASDLATYRSYYHLPACTTASGCLRVVNQSGGSSLPAKNANWATEISLDVDMVSAICPNCHLLVVEATTSSNTNLGAAVNTAARLGADAISNSYGGPETTSELKEDSAFYDHPGIAVTASSGDSGYGVDYPAASPYVTAAGGTTLNQSSTGRGWTETAWSDAGSGCSAYEAQPTWQSTLGNITSACAKRAEADVSADANPNTGVSIYDSTPYLFEKDWETVGGTSVASPIIASVYALAGNTASVTGAALPYADPSGLYDVTSGSNGSCGGTPLCTAVSGWDGPTGLGTPDGVGAF